MNPWLIFAAGVVVGIAGILLFAWILAKIEDRRDKSGWA